MAATTMFLRTIFVTRHGARIDNGPDRDPQWFEKITAHRRCGDAPLSPVGHQEAEELATEFVSLLQQQQKQEQEGRKDNKNNNKSIVIVSSPYIRCLETADAVARRLNSTCTGRGSVMIMVEPGIAEVGSTPSSMALLQEELLAKRTSLTSQSHKEANHSYMYSFAPRIDPTYIPVMTRTDFATLREWGDSDAAKRAARVATIIAEERFPHVPVILFVGHGASCLGLVSAFGGPAHSYIGYCSLTQFQQQQSSINNDNNKKKPKWKLVGKLGDVSHLSDPQVSLNSAW